MSKYPASEGWLKCTLTLRSGAGRLTQEQVLKFLTLSKTAVEDYEVAQFKHLKTCIKITYRKRVNTPTA